MVLHEEEDATYISAAPSIKVSTISCFIAALQSMSSFFASLSSREPQTKLHKSPDKRFLESSMV